MISPEEYLRRFGDPLADVQLVNRYPKRPLHTTYHRGPAFDKYLLLGHATHQLWVDSRFKGRFLEEVNKWQMVQPGKFAYQATEGNSHVPTSVFVSCLVAAGCHTIRLKAYGQKMPLLDRFILTEPAQLDHQWREHNEWDIGRNFDSTYIWLFASATGVRHGITHYPIMGPGSRDYGTVNLKVTHRSRKFQVKMYPRLVHVIKSFNSHLQGNIPTTLRGVKSQVGSAVKMVHNLTGKTARELGGFRIEVTVQAESLAQARQRVERTPFLDPAYWLHLGDGPHYANRISARVVERKAFLENANWVHQQAEAAGIFFGTEGNAPSREQVQVLTDILSALGWNKGLRTSTKSLAPDAWWNLAAARPSVFQQLCQRYRTDGTIKDLFNLARAAGGVNGLPCKKEPTQRNHRYQVNGQNPFRIRCCVRGCYHKLSGANILQWVAQLVTDGVLEEGRLGLEGGQDERAEE